jgi:hypothetical protein
VTVNNADVLGVNFSASAALAIDVVAYGDTNSASTRTFSTAGPNELAAGVHRHRREFQGHDRHLHHWRRLDLDARTQDER